LLFDEFLTFRLRDAFPHGGAKTSGLFKQAQGGIITSRSVSVPACRSGCPRFPPVFWAVTWESRACVLPQVSVKNQREPGARGAALLLTRRR
jgi:hypothetical protein